MRVKITPMIAGAAALAWACASNQGVNKQSQPSAASAVYASQIVPTKGTSESNGTNASAATGMWADSVGGMWIDGEGAMYVGGQNGMAMGLQSSDISAWTN